MPVSHDPMPFSRQGKSHYRFQIASSITHTRPATNGSEIRIISAIPIVHPPQMMLRIFQGIHDTLLTPDKTKNPEESCSKKHESPPQINN
jgi:hypothetical protein